jgi:hypothetical protein
MHVAVLGAPGVRGRRVVRDLLERPQVTRVTLVGPQERDLSRLVGALDPRRVSAAPVPLTVEGIAGAFTAADIAVGALDHQISPDGSQAEAELTALEAALSADIAYVTACEHPAILDRMLSPRYARAEVGHPVIVGMSWTPGVSNLLVRAAAERLDAVRSVRVAWCTSRYDEGADGLERLLTGWSGEALAIRDGEAVTCFPGARPEDVFFPEPVGWQRVHTVRGAEVITLPGRFPGLDSMVVRGGMAGASASSLLQMVARSQAFCASSGDGGRSRRGTARRKLQVLTRGLALGLGPLAPRATGWSGLRIDVGGRRGGAERTETLGIVDHLANLESGPLVVAAVMAGQGESTGRGVLAPEAAFVPERFVALLAERGIRAARLRR